jgi:hypothetical protein
MLNETIEKNERFLRVCSSVAKFTGVLLLVFIAIQIGGTIFLFFENGRRVFANNVLCTFGYTWAFTALLLLGIDQLIKCLIETDFKPNWILRFADKIIYFYICCLCINFAYRVTISWTDQNAGNDWVSMTFGTVSMLIKVLLWIGFGQVMRRIIPIIQESKTLV